MISAISLNGSLSSCTILIPALRGVSYESACISRLLTTFSLDIDKPPYEVTETGFVLRID